SLVVALSSELLRIAELGPRARGPPRVLVAVRQVKRDSHAGGEAAALCKLWARVGIQSRIAKLFGGLEERVGPRNIPRGLSARNCRRQEDDQDGKRAPCHS